MRGENIILPLSKNSGVTTASARSRCTHTHTHTHTLATASDSSQMKYFAEIKSFIFFGAREKIVVFIDQKVTQAKVPSGFYHKTFPRCIVRFSARSFSFRMPQFNFQLIITSYNMVMGWQGHTQYSLC